MVTEIGTGVGVVGGGGALIIVIVKEVIAYLKTRDNKQKNNPNNTANDKKLEKLEKVETIILEKLGKVEKVTDDIYEMHNTKDPDGIYTWYVPRSWASVQENIVEIMRDISMSQRDIAKTLERLERKDERSKQ